MIKMDLSTKQVFLAGFLTWVITFGGFALGYIITIERHDVRLRIVEETLKERTPLVAAAHETIARVKQHDTELSQHSDHMRQLSTNILNIEKESSRVVQALETVAKSNEKVVDVVAGMQQQMARIETKLEQLEK